MTHFPLVTVLLAAALAAEEAPGPEPEPVITARSELAFDWAGLDTEGEPTVAVRIEFRLFRLGADPPQQFGYGRSIDRRLEEAGTVRVPAAEIFTDVGSTRVVPGRWEVMVRVVDESGVKSLYSSPLVVVIPPPRPAAPIELRVGEEER